MKYNNKPIGNQMENEVKEIKESTKRVRRTVVMTVDGIPAAVHNKVKLYRAKINHERNKTYNLREAYREFLIEKTK